MFHNFIKIMHSPSIVRDLMEWMDIGKEMMHARRESSDVWDDNALESSS